MRSSSVVLIGFFKSGLNSFKNYLTFLEHLGGVDRLLISAVLSKKYGHMSNRYIWKGLLQLQA